MQNQKNPYNFDIVSSIISFLDTKQLLDAHIEHKQLFLFKYNSYYAVFRLLTIAELESIRGLAKLCNLFFIEDWITSHAVIFTSDILDNTIAGISSKLAKSIVKKSDSSDEKNYIALLEEQRSKTETLDMVTQSVINRVFPTINISNLTFVEKTRLLAVSELMLNTKISIGANKKTAKGPKARPGYSSIGGAASEEASRILSKENADKPDFAKDNEMLRGL